MIKKKGLTNGKLKKKNHLKAIFYCTFKKNDDTKNGYIAKGHDCIQIGKKVFFLSLRRTIIVFFTELYSLLVVDPNNNKQNKTKKLNKKIIKNKIKSKKC